MRPKIPWQLLFAASHSFASSDRSLQRVAQAVRLGDNLRGGGKSTEVKMVYVLDVGNSERSSSDRGQRASHPPNITEVIVMNEQGAHPFDQYRDSSGTSLLGEEIGCWDEVTADEAALSVPRQRVGFYCLRSKAPGLFRGRELVGSRLAWAGFGYSFPPGQSEN